MFDLDKGVPKSLSQLKAVILPKDKFWADPHVIQANDHYYIFIEEYIYMSRKSHISVIEMDGQGNWSDPIRVLERDYHLSYPLVFEWEGKYYMVPESAANKTTELYECFESPHKWKYKMNLIPHCSITGGNGGFSWGWLSIKTRCRWFSYSSSSQMSYSQVNGTPIR